MLEKINSVVIAEVNTNHLEKKPPRGGIPATDKINMPKVLNKAKLQLSDILQACEFMDREAMEIVLKN